MSESTTTTPLPWRLKAGSGTHVVAGTEQEPYTVCNTWSGPFAPERHVAAANARFIALACNHHQALVDALESLLQCRGDADWPDCVAVAQEALAKVREAQ